MEAALRLRPIKRAKTISAASKYSGTDISKVRLSNSWDVRLKLI
jgi:hypothetical protein